MIDLNNKEELAKALAYDKEWSSNMWESPINAIYEAQKNAFDGAVLSAVMKVGIDVDKEELTKALAYDRQQYEKGYADAKAEIVRCKDCKHYVYGEDEEQYYCRKTGIGREEDFYCAHGERRTYEETIHQYHERRKEVLKEMSTPVGRNVMDALRERRTDETD